MKFTKIDTLLPKRKLENPGNLEEQNYSWKCSKPQYLRVTCFKLSRNGSSHHHLKQQFSVSAPRPAASASPENLQKCRFWGPTSQLLNQKLWKGSPEIHVLTNLPYDSDPHDTLRAPIRMCCTQGSPQQHQYHWGAGKKMQNPRLSPDMLSRTLYFVKIPRGLTCLRSTAFSYGLPRWH